MYGMLKNEQDMKKAEQEKWKNIISEAVCDGIIEAFSLLKLTPLTTEEPVYGLSAEVLEKKGWVNPIRCKDCHNWLRIKNNKKIGSHYCDVDLQAYGVMCNCPPTHFCSYGEPKEGEE